ncbi:MAG TPA: toxin-antitoxin system YwqK family antitoxin [Candidatus Binataceae bacterium]|nr:toxin-antitoxin system YwqK family antitoxin [Candidatus Binataceae bacterium]
MKPKAILTILALFAMLLAGCNGGGSAAPARPTCAEGTKLMGEGPPDGSELYCAKTINGQEVKDGPFLLYRPDGSLMMLGSYHDGKQDGEWTLWHDNGQKASIDHYKDGVQDGEHIGWYDNGKISAKGQYKDGKREGTWKRWDPDGYRNWEEHYKDDQKVS